MASALTRNVRRAAVPTAVVAGIAAVGAGIWPALASDGSPDLPETTAEELLVLVAESETAQLSGTVRVSMDLGIPGLPDLGGVVSSALGEGSGPAGALADLASGDSTLRVAVDGDERQRLTVVDGDDEFAVIHNGENLWAYDSANNQVFHATAPEGGQEAEREQSDWLGSLTPQEAAERLLDEAGAHANISVDGTAQVAGRDAYQLLVEPNDADARVSSVRISVDAETGVPLAATAEDADGGQLLDVSFSQVTYEQPAGGTFDFTPPRDAEVLEIEPGASFGGLMPEILPDTLPDELSDIEHGELPEGLPGELTDLISRS